MFTMFVYLSLFMFNCVYLIENDVKGWIKCLSEESNNFKNLNDTNGFLFSLINQHVANYYHTGKIESGKTGLANIIKALIDKGKDKIKVKEKPAEKILMEMKSRIECAMEMYKKLLEVEEELSKKVSVVEDKKPSSKILIKIFLKHALNFLTTNDENNNPDKLKNTEDMKLQMELALKLIDNDEFDFSKINIFNIDSEITKSLKILFDNILFIKYKCNLQGAFKKYMKKLYGFETRIDYVRSRYEQSMKVFQAATESIMGGNIFI